jgi:hypothetical protein
MAYGAIPDGLFVLHRCDTPNCVRPDHLFLGNQQDNVNDMMQKQRNHTGPRQRGISAPKNPMKGERHHTAKLSENDVREIRRRWDEGETQTSIAKDYGVWQTTISVIVRGVGWKHT